MPGSSGLPQVQRKSISSVSDVEGAASSSPSRLKIASHLLSYSLWLTLNGRGLDPFPAILHLLSNLSDALVGHSDLVRNRCWLDALLQHLDDALAPVMALAALLLTALPDRHELLHALEADALDDGGRQLERRDAAAVFELAEKEQVTPAVAADRLAEQRMRDVGRLRGIWLGA